MWEDKIPAVYCGSETEAPAIACLNNEETGNTVALEIRKNVEEVGVSVVAERPISQAKHLHLPRKAVQQVNRLYRLNSNWWKKHPVAITSMQTL